MDAVLAHERNLTQIDHARLTRLVNGEPAHAGAGSLRALLALSQPVPSASVAPDVVTMYSQVLAVDEGTGARMKYAVCYPGDAEPAAGFISILAPAGMALLGLRVGDVARWTGPGGKPHGARVVEMLFQPESTGDYTT